MEDDDYNLDTAEFKEVKLPSLDMATKADHRWRRRLWRASISESALLTTEEVAEALPGRAQLNRRWLDGVPRIRLPSGQEVFLWGEVLRHLERVA